MHGTDCQKICSAEGFPDEKSRREFFVKVIFFAIFIPAFCIFAHCVLYYFYQTVENLPGQRELIRQAVCKRTGGNRHEEYHYDQP